MKRNLIMPEVCSPAAYSVRKTSSTSAYLYMESGCRLSPYLCIYTCSIQGWGRGTTNAIAS